MASRRILGSRSHFETLNLPMRHLACSDVRSSFLSLAKEVHPDHCKEAEAEAAFKKLAAAYEALRCPRRRTAHLEFVKHQAQRDPSRTLAAMDEAAKPWILGAAVGLFFGAELVRIAFAEEKEEPLEEVVAAMPPMPPRGPPLSPAFSSAPGEPLVGPSREEVAMKLANLRASRRQDSSC
mmetsp:Transcript_10563/g.34890  ORF Transcript_10563/g.34890 Transcript_10563/m.34890 type:complete len:180 (-) Transcript_10563:83-622(-)